MRLLNVLFLSLTLFVTDITNGQLTKTNMENSNKEQIINTLQGLFMSTDSRDWQKCKSYFIEKPFVDYSSLNGEAGKVVNAADLIKGWESFLPKFKSTQHMLTNFEININGDKADARFYGHAIHHLPHAKGGDMWGLYGIYTASLVNVESRWKIASFVLTVNYEEGNKSMLSVISNLPKEQKVKFESEGETIVGNLVLPSGYKQEQKLPVVMIFGAWTQVKEQTQYVYGRKLAEQGYAVLNFDFRYWGESGGKPRSLESTDEKVKDVLNAIKFLKSHPAIDASNMSLIGVCAGAGVTLRVSGISKDIRNTATVAAWLQHPSTTPGFYGGAEGVQERVRLAEATKKKYVETGTADYVDAYNPTNKTAAMFFPLDYYSRPDRGRIPEWNNQFAIMGWKEWMQMNSIDGVAEKINCPIIMVHSDGSSLPDNVKKFYNLVPAEKKKLSWLEGEHTQFYDNDEKIDAALAEIVQFFKM